MKTVYLIDGMFESHKCFAAYRELATSSGVGTGVIFGVLRGLASYRKVFGPGEIIYCWEGQPKRRIKLDPEYKQGRVKSDSSLFTQVDKLREVLQIMGISQVASPDWEADDVLSSLATEKATMGYRVVIVTGDDDLLQMVRDEGDTGPIVVYNPKLKLTYNEAAVKAKYGVKPEDLIYQWAIEGDASDNIPPTTSDRTLRAQIREALLKPDFSLPSLTADPLILSRYNKNVELLRLQVDVDNIIPIVPAKDEAKMQAVFTELQFNSFLKPEKFPEWAAFADQKG